MENTDLSVHTIASQERVSAAYIYRLLRLPSLAPDMVSAIINGKNPPQLTAKKLMRLTTRYRPTGSNKGNYSASKSTEVVTTIQLDFASSGTRSQFLPIDSTKKVNPKCRPGAFLVRDGEDPAQKLLCRLSLGRIGVECAGFRGKTVHVKIRNTILYQYVRRWLCCEAAAKESPLLKFPNPRENTGNLRDMPPPRRPDPLEYEVSLDEFPAMGTGNFLMRTGKYIALAAN